MSRHIEVYHDIYYNMTDNTVIAVTTSNITQLFLINYHMESTITNIYNRFGNYIFVITTNMLLII